ncbi:SAM-dependent methyltransferase [Rubrobacter aplysinae]|uniref:SAM-dependent methyltransferase n=1 Tax=Rubrobacter aplysinae TaxID=909625 RepID=UPI00064C3BFD|nr:SAM-dependent methyltransferase [Rubrobacter aplysinae]
MTQAERKIDTSVAAQTGVAPTMMVAIEQNFPGDQRIIHDELALKILPVGYQFLVKLTRIPVLRDWMVRASEKQVGGIWSGIVCRKRYIDDTVVLAVAGENSVDAVVNLGAGYDTRVYRLPALANVPVWEVDQPANIEAKQANLQKALGKIPTNVTLVPINFVEQELGPVLAAHGYAADTKTFFVWEAVSQYLTETAVRQTFDFLAQAPAGSRWAFTYVRKDFVEGEELYGLEKFYERMIVKNNAWHFGFEPEEVAGFLGEYGWRMIEHLGYDDLADRYVKPTGRELPFMAIERMVYAEKE